MIRKISSSSTLGPDDVYIGRNPRHGDPFWGNPFRLVDYNNDRAFVLRLYEEWLKTADHILARIDELRGKTLWCHCYPLDCHGEILAEVAAMSHEARERWRVSEESCLDTFFE
jgi:hypothetical protein